MWCTCPGAGFGIPRFSLFTFFALAVDCFVRVSRGETCESVLFVYSDDAECRARRISLTNLSNEMSLKSAVKGTERTPSVGWTVGVG
uniref:Putative secreted protein n=1 Tax=Anopheles marajoara TaxID=58244 RepID=A0A2M4CAD9_9DIPT